MLQPRYKITIGGGKYKIAINYDFVKMFTFDYLYAHARAIMEGTQTAAKKSKPIAAENYRLLNNKEIKKAIAEKQAQLRAANPNGVYEILEFLTAVMRGNVIECIPLFKGKGKQEYQKGKPRTSDRLKAAELLGKYYGMFTDRQHTNSGGNVIIINDIPNNRE